MKKLNVKSEVEVEADAIRIVVPVNYGDEDMPAEYPFRVNDMWDVTVDLDTGQIRNWPGGVAPLNLSMKVVDQGCYYLLNGSETLVSSECDYVPGCIPGQYGDYIDLNIDATGRITNWSEKCNAYAIGRAFYGDDFVSADK